MEYFYSIYQLNHCISMIDDLNTWINTGKNDQILSIVAINIDDTPKENNDYKTIIDRSKTWKHFCVEGGLNSDLANKYAIISTPSLFMIDSKNNIITNLPNNLFDIELILKTQ